MKMAIIQTTRLGDVIQTAQAARILKEYYPHIELTLIGRRRFVEPLRFLCDKIFDSIITFETKDFVSYEEKKTPERSVSSLKSFLEKINNKNIDVLVNLSFSKSSSFLTNLIKAKQKLGMSRDRFSKIKIDDLWSQFIYSNVQRGSQNPYNLVDLYKKILGVSFLKSKTNMEATPREKLVVIHPFASQKRKKWGHSKWIEVTYFILKNFPEHRVAIVGGKEDREYEKYFLESTILGKYQDRIDYNIANKEIRSLYLSLRKAQLFVGHDSMVGHLASEAQTPTLTISLGTVRPHETTPYHSKAINVAPRISCFPCTPTKKCDLLPCHGQVSYQAICKLIEMKLQNIEISHQNIQDKISIFHLENINIFKAYDPGHGEQELEELIHLTPEINSIFKIYYKILWSLILSDVELSSNPPRVSIKTAKELEHYQKGLTSLFEIYRFGATFAKQLIEDINQGKKAHEIKETFSKISEIDTLTPIVKQNYPLLAPLVDFYFVAIANIREEELIQVAESALLIFDSAQNAVSALFELSGQTLEAQIHFNDKDHSKLLES